MSNLSWNNKVLSYTSDVKHPRLALKIILKLFFLPLKHPRWQNGSFFVPHLQKAFYDLESKKVLS